MSADYDGPRLQSWMDGAACAGKPLEWWYPATPHAPNGQARAAKALCNTCPVQTECLQFALDSDDRHGIFGGLLPHERYALTHKKPLRKDSRWLRP
jgi:WhiB family redox-sensing transcriptional regulator